MTNIFFIHRFTFNRDTFIKDEFQYFIDKGYNVKYLDVSGLLKKKDIATQTPKDLERFVVRFTKRKQFSEFMLANEANSIVTSDVGLLFNSAWMYHAIFKANIPHIVSDNTSLPTLKKEKSWSDRVMDFKKHLGRFSFRKIYQKPLELIDYQRARSILKPAEIVITTKERLSAEKKALCTPLTPIIYSTSIDYSIAQNIVDKPDIEVEYAVFVDQYFVHHPDFKTNHIVHSFTAKDYYTELNAFLKQFSEQTGLKVVIAAHPRRNDAQKKDFLPEFELRYNQTAALIKHCKIALLHFSTAISFAVIFNKPFLLLHSNLFAGSSITGKINMFAQYFNKAPLNISGPFEFSSSTKNHWFDVNAQRHQAYTNSFLKHPQADGTSFAQQIEGVIEKLQFKNPLEKR